MKSKKNKPPKGVIVAIGAIVVMIIVYLILWMVFPEIFESLNEGKGV